MKLEFLENKGVIGMIHCLPLPGAMSYGGDMKAVTDRALADLEAMERAGVDAVIVENFCDKPITAKLDPGQMAALSAVTALVKERSTIPVGVDAAFCDPVAGLAIAVATGAEFIRVPVFTDTVITAAGRIEPCAAELMKWRKLLGGEDVALLCDIQTKHTFMVSGAISLEESASMAEENGADAIIVTGAHTGSSSSVDTIQRVRGATSLPLIAGSGVNAKNLPEQLSLVDAAIIGSSMKRHGKAWEPIDYELAKDLMDAAKAFRAGL